MNKQLEYFYLEELLKIMKIETKDIQEQESPDFILDLGEKIGVEITSIKQSNNSKSAGNARKIVRIARERAEKNGLAPLDIHIWFYDHIPTNTQKYIKEASEYLYELISQNIKNIQKANGQITKINASGNKYGGQ